MDNLEDVWFYAKPAAWAALKANARAGAEYPVAAAVTGYWNSFQTEYEVYNTLCTPTQKQAITAALGADVVRVFVWKQGTGIDITGEAGATIPEDVLAVMKPNENGPASYSNPNWGHMFIHQAERIFAGQFTTQFSGQFS